MGIGGIGGLHSVTNKISFRENNETTSFFFFKRRIFNINIRFSFYYTPPPFFILYKVTYIYTGLYIILFHGGAI